MKKLSHAEKIKQYAKHAGPITIARASRDLAIPYTAADSAIRSLVERGWLVKAPGTTVYEYREVQPQDCGRAAELQRVMWRVLRMPGATTTWDVAQLSGASIKYADAYIRYCCKAGRLTRAGKSGPRALWRVTDPRNTAVPYMTGAKANAEEEKRLAILAEIWPLVRAVLDGDLDEARDALVGVNIVMREE